MLCTLFLGPLGREWIGEARGGGLFSGRAAQETLGDLGPRLVLPGTVLEPGTGRGAHGEGLQKSVRSQKRRAKYSGPVRRHGSGGRGEVPLSYERAKKSRPRRLPIIAGRPACRGHAGLSVRVPSTQRSCNRC